MRRMERMFGRNINLDPYGNDDMILRDKQTIFDLLSEASSNTIDKKTTTSTFSTKSTSTLVSTSTKTRQNIGKRIVKKPIIASGDKEETKSENTQVVTTKKRRSTIITRSKSKAVEYDRNATKQVEVSVERSKKSTTSTKKTLVSTSVKTIPNLEGCNVTKRQAMKDIRSNISVIATGDEPAIKSGNAQAAQLRNKRAQTTVVTKSSSRTQENDRKVTKQATELSVSRNVRSQKVASTEKMSRDRAIKSVDASTALDISHILVDKHASNKSYNQVPVKKNIVKSLTPLQQSTLLTGNENRRQVRRLKIVDQKDNNAVRQSLPPVNVSILAETTLTK